MVMRHISTKKGRWKDTDIDLTGPKGNVFWLIGLAIDICEFNGLEYGHIVKRMNAGDYQHALEVFDLHFGYTFTLYYA